MLIDLLEDVRELECTIDNVEWRVLLTTQSRLILLLLELLQLRSERAQRFWWSVSRCCKNGLICLGSEPIFLLLSRLSLERKS